MQHSIASEKPEIAIGVLGADGHGKTSLATVITQAFSPQTSSVKGQEIVISLGNCREDYWEDISPGRIYETTMRRYILFDFQRHSNIVENLILNWLPLNGIILVVSAVDGVTAQTREQMRLVKAVGVDYLVVFLNKCDRAQDTELLDLAELEVRDLLSEHNYTANTSVIRGSALAALNNFDISPFENDPLETNHFDYWRGNIQYLLKALDDSIPVPQKIEEKPFLMCIEDVFLTPTKDTIVVGHVERGSYRLNTLVELVGLGPTYSTTGTDMETFHKKCDSISCGDRAGIVLRGVNRAEAQRGQVLAAPGTIQAYARFRAEFYLWTQQENGRDRYDLLSTNYAYFIRTVEISGKLTLDKRNGPLRGGDTIRCTVELEAAVAIEPGLRLVLRQNGRSIGMGVIAEILP